MFITPIKGENMSNLPEMPDKDGNFGEYGGQIISPSLIETMDQSMIYDDILTKREFKAKTTSQQ